MEITQQIMSEQETKDTWSGALREQIVWFVFAILLALGSSYLNAKIQITTIEARIARAEEDISEIEQQTVNNKSRTRNMELDMVRVEEKLDALLRKNGIDPSSFRDP